MNPNNLNKNPNSQILPNEKQQAKIAYYFTHIKDDGAPVSIPGSLEYDANTEAAFFEKVKQGEISNEDYRKFLRQIATPIGSKFDENRQAKIDNVLAQTQGDDMSTIVLSSYGFRSDDGLSANPARPNDLLSFYEKFPEPISFQPIAKDIIDRLQPGSGFQTAELEMAMDHFEQLVFGKQYEYMKQIEDMRQKAVADIPGQEFSALNPADIGGVSVWSIEDRQ